MDQVKVTEQIITIPTYEPAEAESLPMFAENRVHQRTSGNPYPNPVVNRVRRDAKTDTDYRAVTLENDYLEILILPELGGRIFTALDKTNGRDFFYRQHVIKPALIGMLGLWISGGLEFNWPLHHRPSTFMPTDYTIRRGADGGAVVWLGEHEPLDRMKGMVGIALSPKRAVFETRMKLFNRTYLPHSFLWWENAALPVSPDFQIFFPPDVTYASFHYKKATGGYPVMDEFFNVQDNRGGNDIRFHRNTSEATSYFSGASRFDFFGGYDRGAEAGVIHYASHHTSTGKKMFTWGYNRLSKAWEEALTDTDGQYVELMAGSYSDNQPDFTWIEPFELKEFTQSWYPYKDIGEPKNANDRLALSCRREGGNLSVGLYPTEDFEKATIELRLADTLLSSLSLALKAAIPFFLCLPFPAETSGGDCVLLVRDSEGRVILDHVFKDYESFIPEPRKDNPHLEDLKDAEGCYRAGLHVDQYRDPLVKPFAYWEAGLAFDPDHAPCLTALGRYHLGLQNYREAETCLRKAVSSLTRYNPNPRDTEAFYLLGISLLGQGRRDEARESFCKALWGRSQAVAAGICIAELDCLRGDFPSAEASLRFLIRTQGENQRASALLSSVLRHQGKIDEAVSIVELILEKDPLDYWALNERRLLSAAPFLEALLTDREQVALDLAFDYASSGMYSDGLDVLHLAEALADEPSSMLLYAEGYTASLLGDEYLARNCFLRAAQAKRGGCFPFRSGEADALFRAVSENPLDGRARLELGNILYGRRRDYTAAAACWDAAAKLLPDSPEVFRNLSVSRYNRNNADPEAMAYIEKALSLDPANIQLLYERGLLAELQGLPVERRIEMGKSIPLNPALWDDLYLQGVRLYNQAGLYEESLRLLSTHTFIPCEGGEHAVANEYLFAHFALGHRALRGGSTEEALMHFRSAMKIPANLGGGVWHRVMLVPYLCGEGLCLEILGKKDEALKSFTAVAYYPVNYFTEMYLPAFRYYRGLALTHLGRNGEGGREFEILYEKASEGFKRRDLGYFAATPFFHSYIEHPRLAREKHFSLLLGLARLGQGKSEDARRHFERVLSLEPAHAMAALYLHTILEN